MAIQLSARPRWLGYQFFVTAFDSSSVPTAQTAKSRFTLPQSSAFHPAIAHRFAGQTGRRRLERRMAHSRSHRTAAICSRLKLADGTPTGTSTAVRSPGIQEILRHTGEAYLRNSPTGVSISTQPRRTEPSGKRAGPAATGGNLLTDYRAGVLPTANFAAVSARPHASIRRRCG
jgi:hypothetical protein